MLGARRRARVTLMLAALSALGCERACASDAGEDRAPARSATSNALPKQAGDGGQPGTSLVVARLGHEAARAQLDRAASDPLVATHRQLLTEHFGGALPRRQHVQAIASEPARQLAMFARHESDADGVIVSFSAGTLHWSKPHPLRGVSRGARQLALAAGPDGEVVLGWYHQPTHLVALRRWARDGGIIADFEVLHVDRCDALSLLYWPGQGWVVAAAHPGGSTLQLLGTEGRRRWGDNGKPLPAEWWGVAPVGLAALDARSIVLVRAGRNAATADAGQANRLYAWRLDAAGAPLWGGRLYAGELSQPAPGARPLLETLQAGRVLARLGGLSVEIDQTGRASRRAR